jgi:hypothetical protein
VAVKLDTAAAATAATDDEQGASGGARQRHASSSGAQQQQRRVSDGSSSLAKAAAKPPPSGKLLAKGPAADYVISFDRLLLGKKDTQTFTISNTGVLPVKWRLAGAAQLPAEFKVQPSDGELPARSKTQVVVEFSALKKQELAELLTLEVRKRVCGRLVRPRAAA